MKSVGDSDTGGAFKTDIMLRISEMSFLKESQNE
jgi:hypothetical protein